MFSFTLGVAACAAAAQQSMPDMPGMQMKPTETTPQPRPNPKSNHSEQAPGPIPRETRSMQGEIGDTKAKAAADQSPQHNAARPQGKPTIQSDAESIHIPIQDLQEPEAIGIRTGSDVPAPDRLSSVLNHEPMTVEIFLELAERSNPTLVQAQRDVDRANQQGRQAGLPPNPVFGYSGDHIRGGSYHGGEEGLFFSQEFVLGSKLALRRDVYRAQGRSNEFAVAIQRARIRNDVAHAFFNSLAAQESMEIDHRLLQVALDGAKNAHELERVGQADAPDVLNAELTAEQAKVEYVNSQHEFLASFAQLAANAGQPALSPHILAGQLQDPPQIGADSIVAADIQDSPAVKQAQANVTVAEARVRSAKREKVPNLNIKGGEWYSGEDLGSTARKAGFESFVEAGVQIPLWNRNQGSIEAAKIELEQARQDITRTQLLIRTRAETLAQQYQAARYTAEKYRTEILPRARRAYELEVMKYQQMAQNYSHVLTAQRMLFTLQQTYVHALNQEWSSAISLQNDTLQNALDETMSPGRKSSTENLPNTSGGMN
jgi:cobalt-zinc-cadmium efflux system outer membrane protein